MPSYRRRMTGPAAKTWPGPTPAEERISSLEIVVSRPVP